MRFLLGKEGARWRDQEVTGHRKFFLLFFQVNTSSPERPQRKLQVSVIEGQETPSKYW